MIAASNLSTSSQFNHLGQTYYNRVAEKPLLKRFRFWLGVDNRVLPLKNGKTIQFFRYSQLGANTTTTTEGILSGTPIAMAGSSVVTATVGQYSDFISLSDMLVNVAIDGDIVAEASNQLGYRAGLSCDEIIKAEVDSVNASIEISLLGDYLAGADLAGVRARLAASEIQPIAGNFFRAIWHPYMTYDLVHDPSVGGFVDVNKQPGGREHNLFYEVPGDGPVLRFGNVEAWESTNVTVTSGTPNTYRVYFFGADGLAAIDLAGKGPTRTADQRQMKFKVHVERNLKPTVANPEGKVAAFASYNFVFVAKVLDSTTYRMRTIDAPTALGL